MNANNLHRFGVISNARIACRTDGCRGRGAIVLAQGPAEDFNLNELHTAAFRHITEWTDARPVHIAGIKVIEPDPPALVPAGGRFGAFLFIVAGAVLAVLGGILMEALR